MQGWLQILLVTLSSVFIITLIIMIMRRCLCAKNHHIRDIAVVDPIQPASTRLHQVSIQHLDRDGSNKRTNHYVIRHHRNNLSSKNRNHHLFNWDDHPNLVTDAVENGWSRFDFSASIFTSISSKSTMLGSCGDHDRQMCVEIDSEVSQGSVDFMQKIRFNSGFSSTKKIGSISAMVRTSLPLPGPSLKGLAFPQEAYFEITILPLFEELSKSDSFGKVKGRKWNNKSEKTEDFNGKAENPEPLIHAGSIHSTEKVVDEFKAVGKQVGKAGNVVLSVGLAGGGPLPLKLPGSYAGSIGFNSNGSVYLDGVKLVTESETEDWGKEEMVIGCGYNPGQKKVIFTLDSHIIHEIHCQSEEFGTPLYPILAANADVTVIVNLGQCAFKYAQANLYRTPNPCFMGPQTHSSPALSYYEDSKELFSMGRIDSHWYHRSMAARSNNTTGTLNPAAEFDGESEGDLFEIVLDNMEKSSPYS